MGLDHLHGRHFSECLIDLDVFVELHEVVGTCQQFPHVQRGQITIVVQLLQDLFNEIDFFTIVDFLDGLVVDLAFDLLDAVDLRH